MDDNFLTMTTSDARLAQLHDWLKETFGNINYSLEPVSGDASFRRYFRFTSDKHHLIAIDSPPDKEKNDAFVHVTHLLATAGLSVPHIHYSTLDFGYFLVSDLGDTLLLHRLTMNNVDSLYVKAMDVLITLQQIPSDGLPLYDELLLLQEMELFREWFMGRHLNIYLNEDENNALTAIFQHLVSNALRQPQVFVHRDYHSRNLMKSGEETLSIIDYQDAVTGPVTYDVVSLLRDCYIAWPEEKVRNLALQFYKKLCSRKIVSEINENEFIKWFDLMGIQRHLKAIGIFARLNIRDHKANYLDDIPRTLHYIKSVSRQYSETRALVKFLDNRINI